MRIAYEERTITGERLAMVERATAICARYLADGYDLTLRQLYYQFVAHDLFPESRCYRLNAAGKWRRDPDGTRTAEPNYKWLGDIMTDARNAGYWTGATWWTAPATWRPTTPGMTLLRSSAQWPSSTTRTAGRTSRSTARCGWRRKPCPV